jgi:hypothetical protein
MNFASTDVNLNASIQAAIINAIFDNPTANIWTCPPNSSCVWETSATLGVCSSCTNVTAETEVNCPDEDSLSYMAEAVDASSGIVCNYTTPSNFTLQSHDFNMDPDMRFLTRMNTTTTWTSQTNQTTSNDSAEIIGFATLLLDQDQSFDIHECSLSWCAKVFRDATAQGSLFSVHLDDYPLNYEGYWLGPVQQAYGVYEAQSGFPTSLNSTFTVQGSNAQDLSEFLANVLATGSVTEYFYQSVGPSDTFKLGDAMMKNPSTLYMADSIAISLTNAIRNLSSDYISHNLGDSAVQIQFISVRWKWLAFPASIVLLGILLLLTTMIQSHRENALVWKCSTLALLFHPLQGWNDREMARTSKKEMDKCAKGMRGQLSQSDDAGLRIIKA